MPRLERIQSQDVAAPPPSQQAAVRPVLQKKVTPTPTTKNEKRKQSPVHHGNTNQSSSTMQKKKAKTQKKKKDPNEPKQTRSAYNFYTKDARPKLVAAGMTSVSNVNSQLGAQWKALSAEEKLPYERMALEDRGRYMKEKTAYDNGIKNNASNETNKKAEGGAMSNPVEMGEGKCNTLMYAMGDDEKKNDTADVKMKYTEVINTEVVKEEATNALPNDVPSPDSQKSLESVDVDVLVEPQEKNDLLKMTTTITKVKNTAPPSSNGGNKENNNAGSSKAGKGFMGLNKSLAAAKSGVTRLFNNKSKTQEQKSSESQTVVRAGSYIAVVRKREGSNDALGDAKVDEADDGEGVGEGVSGSKFPGEEEGGQKVSSQLIFGVTIICRLHILSHLTIHMLFALYRMICNAHWRWNSKMIQAR
jgi:hypothetical protein